MLVVTGNPGVGKHTVSKVLAEKLGYHILDINQIAIKNQIYQKSGSTLDVDTKKLEKKIKKLLKPNMVVVGHLAPYVIPKSQVKFAIVLRKNPYKLIPIYKKRKYSQKKIYENLGSEILGVIAYDARSRFGKKALQVDATGLSVSKLLKKIHRAMKTKKQDDVDWLGMVSKKGELARFFPK
ncbi:MAG TPA: AAA family ATPase [Candidatus Nitrosotenuis sp.]|nr:AAA family ATPase [Candidatus Nitrosotenuis sp.]